MRERYTDGWITTYTGQKVDLVDPDPETLMIEDAAHVLAEEGRWGNHTRHHWSVAQHSILAYRILQGEGCSLEVQYEGLMHDLAEGWLRDLGKPVKMLMPGYQKLEDNFMRVLSARFNFAYPMSSCIKELDRRLLRAEAEVLMRHPESGHGVRDMPASELDGAIRGQIRNEHKHTVERTFLAIFDRLYTQSLENRP